MREQRGRFFGGVSPAKIFNYSTGEKVCLRISSGCHKEDAEIADCVVVVKSHDGKADEGKNGVEDDNRTAHVMFVTVPGRAIHYYSGEDVWRRNEALRSSQAVAHSIAKDDGQEVGDSVRNRRGTAMEQ